MDYRCTWVRDAAFTMDALWTAACPDEADEFFAFMADAAATGWTRTHLQIMYGIGGEHDLSERELPHLSGWKGSRPVRVGNAASTQPQVDVYGELLDTAARFAPRLDAGNGTQRAFLTSLADAAAEVWHEPDHGIWEIRGAPRHFLYSKLMCWVVLDRALKLAGHLEAQQHVELWRSTRDEIRTASLTDASGLVLRYRTDGRADGLPGGEGSFLLCTFWLAQVQAMAGRTGQAREIFERAASRANDLGLLAEQEQAGGG